MFAMLPKHYGSQEIPKSTSNNGAKGCANVDIPAQTHDNDSLVIEILSSGSGYYGGVVTISSDVISELSEDNCPGHKSLSEFDEQDVCRDDGKALIGPSLIYTSLLH